MATFSAALPYILRHEGGWSKDKDDPGGATNFGITLNVLRGLGRDADLDGDGITGDLDLDHDGDVDEDDLKRMTPELAGLIYQRNYWRFDGVYDQRVATKACDMAVNMGVKAAVRLIQEELNDLGAGLTTDGLYGAKTEATLNAVHPDRMLNLLCMVSADHYRAVVAKRPTSQKFLRGWLARAAEVPHA